MWSRIGAEQRLEAPQHCQLSALHTCRSPARQVRYYLEDDTVDVTEPKQLNSGLPQVPCPLTT